MGRNLEDCHQKNGVKRMSQIRPKSERFLVENPLKKTQTSQTNLIKKNLDDYIFSLSNFEFKQKLESCPGKLGECPLLTEFREGLKKSISNHLSLTPKNDSRLCKTSRNYNSKKDIINNSVQENMSVTNSQHSDSSEKKGGAIKDIKTTNSKGVIRSTRAQDLRSQSNRDLLRPKTMTEKVRTMSPYLLTLPTKKKKSSGAGSSETKASVRTNTTKVTEEKKKQTKTSGTTEKLNKVYKGKVKKEKPSSAGEKVVPLNRQKTQEIINPKIVKKGSKNASGVKVAAGDSFEPPQLKKSQTFFICKGAKNGEGDDKSKESDSRTELNGNSQMDAASDGNGSDEDINSPKPKPLTHNDSFCLIAKSSQQWSQKNRSDDEKWLQYDLTCEEKSTKKTTDKGILKNANHDLKSVDSLEKVESEKIVRFSDEMVRNKKVLKKLVRRKKRIQSLIAPAWYQRNKLFQKYLQVLREKSILLSDQVEMDEELKPFRVPGRIQERYEAEMFGLIHPRRGKFGRSLTKDSFSY